jgi:2-oxoglutarate dehydrogenase complex dehydrogenase (E1) component-like enzyme
LFHLLRRQVHRSTKRPLIVLTPKRYLRGRESYSKVEEFTSGHFREVLDDPGVGERGSVRRVVLCSGKMGLDLLGERARREANQVAIVRVEQLYPWPEDQIVDVLAHYENAGEVYWVQEEPENMGGWTFVSTRLAALLGDDYVLRHIARAPSGSPATGSHALHLLEQADLLERTFADL